MVGTAARKTMNLYFIMIFLLCLIANHHVTAAPQPIPPGLIYREAYDMELPSQTFVDRLKQFVDKKELKLEREVEELAEEKQQLQVLIEAKAASEKERQQRLEFSEEDPEALPVPAAIYHNVHSGKRTSYMALCHFKICNMGRKRQV